MRRVATDTVRFLVYCPKCTAQLFTLAIEAGGSVSATCDSCGDATTLQTRIQTAKQELRR